MEEKNYLFYGETGQNFIENENTRESGLLQLDQSSEQSKLLYSADDLPDAGIRPDIHSLYELQIPDDDEKLYRMAVKMIAENDTGRLAFEVYRAAIERDLTITKLYEYYVYAFPRGLMEMMPKAVFIYFSMNQEHTDEICDRLYANFLSYIDKTDPLYKEYEPLIRDYAVFSALFLKISEDLGIIYDRMLYPGMIDKKAALCIPDVIMAHRIVPKMPGAFSGVTLSYAGVKYKELKNICYAPLVNGRAYIPVYLEDARILFFDENGAEVSDIEYENTGLLNKPSIIDACYKEDDFHPMLLLKAVREMIDENRMEEEDKELCIRALNELSLEEDFRNSIIAYMGKTEGSSEWIDELRESDYTEESSRDIFMALMNSSRYEEAYLLLRKNGTSVTSYSAINKLFTMLIGAGKKPVNGQETDRFFLDTCKELYDRGFAGGDILEELADDYTGSADEMHKILMSAAGAGASLSGLPEKTVEICLNDRRTDLLDDAMEVYINQGRYKDNLIKSYLSLQSSAYFEEEKPVKKTFFETLEACMKSGGELGEMPRLWLLSLSKYFSSKEKLGVGQKSMLSEIAGILIKEGLIFKYTKDLGRRISIPDTISEKYYIEYHGTDQSDPYIELSGQLSKNPVPMKRVFKNIFVYSMVLFVGDSIRYIIKDSGETVKEGSIDVRKLHTFGEDRFSTLNSLILSLREKDVDQLENSMKAYVEKTELYKELFTI